MTYFRKTLMTSSAVTLLMLLVPFNALAESETRRSPVRSGYDSANENVAVYASKHALNETVRQLAYQTTTLQRQLERELNRSYLDGTARERRVNELSADFRHAAEALHSLNSIGQSIDESSAEVGILLQLGDELDQFVSNTRLSRATRESWDAIRYKLAVVADVYDAAENESQDEVEMTPGGEASDGAGSRQRIWRWRI